MPFPCKKTNSATRVTCLVNTAAGYCATVSAATKAPPYEFKKVMGAFATFNHIILKVPSSTNMASKAVIKVDLQGKLPNLASGKVRDLFTIDDSTLLFVASDRISAFDVVMENVSNYLLLIYQCSFQLHTAS